MRVDTCRLGASTVPLSPIRILPVELLTEIFMLSQDPMGGASLSNTALTVTRMLILESYCHSQAILEVIS
jgi:hypothetical protein